MENEFTELNEKVIKKANFMADYQKEKDLREKHLEGRNLMER